MSDLIKLFSKIIKNYDRERSEDGSTSNKAAAKLIYSTIEELESRFALDNAYLRIPKTLGASRLRTKPYILFLDNRVAKSGAKGVYIGLSFGVVKGKKQHIPEDLPYGGVRLSLTRGRDAVKDRLKEDKDYEKSFFKQSYLLGEVFCRRLKEGHSFVTRDAAIVTEEGSGLGDMGIASKIYNISSMTESEFVHDIEALLSVYEDLACYSETHGLSDLEDLSGASDEYGLSVIKQRRGQVKFKQELLKKYEGKCVITGCAVPEALDAAHIVPHSQVTDYRIDNGLLLRADIHRLYDQGLLGIRHDGVVQLKKQLSSSEYSGFHGENIAVNKITEVMKSGLAERYKEFKKG